MADMKNEDVERLLQQMKVPEPEKILPPRDLKIPLLRYRKSSRAGFWLLLIPFTVALTVWFKLELGVTWGSLDAIRRFFSGIDSHVVLTYLIPIIFIGFPLAALVINLLAICHFYQDRGAKELVITVKYRPLNIIILLLSLALIVYFLLPDKLSF